VNAGERFRPGFQYLFPDGPVKPLANGDDILARKNSIGPHVPQVVRRLGVQTAKPSSNTRLFSHQSKGLRVFLFANGDEKNPPMPVVLNIRNCQSFNHVSSIVRGSRRQVFLTLLIQLLETVTVTLQFPSYVRRLYNASTSLRVNSLKELQDGMSLVGVAQGAFKIVPYRIPETSENNAEDDGEGDGLSNAVQICVFLPNGVAFHSGTRATVSRGRFDDINKVSRSNKIRTKRLTNFLSQSSLHTWPSISNSTMANLVAFTPCLPAGGSIRSNNSWTLAAPTTRSRPPTSLSSNANTSTAGS